MGSGDRLLREAGRDEELGAGVKTLKREILVHDRACSDKKFWHRLNQFGNDIQSSRNGHGDLNDGNSPLPDRLSGKSRLLRRSSAHDRHDSYFLD